jgi:hypothetical protein
MEDNIDCLVILWIWFIYIYTYIYADVIVDITPQLITLNQKSKPDMYHTNKHSSIQFIFAKIVFDLFLRLGLLFLKITLGTRFQSVKSTFVFRRKR